VRKSVRASEPSPGEIEAVHLLGPELLWVVVRTTNVRRWRAAQASPRDSTLRNVMFDIYSEVLDVRSGRLLAAEGPIPIGVASRVLPSTWSNRHAEGFVISEGVDGETVAAAMLARLRAR